MADAIVLDHVSFAYPGKPAVVHDLDLRVGVGEVVALVGPTGCGKSTLLHICAGIIPHYQAGDLRGTVTVLGMDTKDVSLGAIAASTGVVTQDPENQLFNLFVADEVAWGMENRGMERGEMNRHLDEALAFFKSSHLRDRITYDLSGGEKQRIVLAATYAPRPGLFLLDGPTSQLDPVGAEQVLSDIRHLATEGNTIVVVEEKLDELWTVVDRVLLLDDGTIKLDVRREQLYEYLDVLQAAKIPLPALVELGVHLRRRGADVSNLPADPDGAAAIVQRLVPRPARPVIGEVSAADERKTRLKVSNLSFRYPPPRPTHALRGIDLEFPAGAIVAVIGHNGSGKTTLARCISGELRPASGAVEIDGSSVHALSIRRRAGLVGYVFQNPDHQIFKDPVIEDVAFGPMNLGKSRAEALEASEKILKSLNLWDKRDVHPFRLPKGERQRMAIAAVAVMAPPVVIIDEPTTGQDLAESTGIMNLLTAMARENNQTIVVITHAMELVAAYADLVVALNEGEIISFGPPHAVFRDEETLRRTFVKPPAIAALGNRLGLVPPPLTLEEAVEEILVASGEAAG